MAATAAQHLRNQLQWTKGAFRLDPEGALRQACGDETPEYLEMVRTAPPAETSWAFLECLERHEPGAGYQRWQELKEHARHDLLSGQLAARVASADAGSPLERAQFLVLLESFQDEWQPRNAIERSLLETLASAYHQWQYWLGACENWKAWENENWDQRKRQHAHHIGVPPRLSFIDTSDRCVEMADRWNRIFLRNVRALRDLRRYSVVIQNGAGGQVNIGQQQVNLAPGVEQAINKAYGEPAA